MKTHFNLFTFLALIAITSNLLSSCGDKVKNPAKPTNEDELITTLKLKFFLATDSSFYKEFIFRDADGEGGADPSQFDSLVFNSNTVYLAELILLNESNASNVQDITEEVKKEAGDHLFCFKDSGASISVNRTDSDGQYEIGINSKWIIGVAGTGKVTVTLKHQPGVKNGTCDPGDTDVEVAFPYLVK